MNAKRWMHDNACCNARNPVDRSVQPPTNMHENN
jgi:hypothetical protein